MFSIGNKTDFNGRKPLSINNYHRESNKHLKCTTYPLLITSTDFYRVLQLSPPERCHEKANSDFCEGYIDPYLRRFIIVDIKNWRLFISNDRYCMSNAISYDIKRHLSGFVDFENDNEHLSVLFRFVKRNFTCDDPGFVLLFPSTGDMFYWEDINYIRLVHELNGSKGFVHIKLPLLTKEKCIGLTMIPPAGSVVSTTAGRFFNIYPRNDNQRLSLVYRMLPLSGSLINIQCSISKITSYPSHVVAIRAGSIKSKYERIVYGLFSNADIYIWEISRKGCSQLLQKKNIRNLIIQRFRLDGDCVNELEFLDLSICKSDPYSLVCLIAWNENAPTKYYAIASVSFNNEMLPTISGFHKVCSYHSLVDSISARIFCPAPCTVIYCVFDSLPVIVCNFKGRETNEFVEESLFISNSYKQFQVMDIASVDAVLEDTNTLMLEFPAIALLTKGNGVVLLESTNCSLDGYSDLRFLKTRLSQYASQNSLLKKQFSVCSGFSSVLPRDRLFPTLLILCDEIARSYPTFHTSVSEILNYQFHKLMETILVSLKHFKLTSTERLHLWLKLAYVNSLVDIYDQLVREGRKSNILHLILQAMVKSGNINDLFLNKSLNIKLLLYSLHTFYKHYASTENTFNFKLLQFLITVNNVFGLVFGNELAYRQEEVIGNVDSTKISIPELWNIEIDSVNLLLSQIEKSIAVDRKKDFIGLKNDRNKKMLMKLQKQILHLIEHGCFLIHELTNSYTKPNSVPAAGADEYSSLEEHFRGRRREWLNYLAQIGYLKRAIKISEHVRDYPSLITLLNSCNFETPEDKVSTQRHYLQIFKDDFAIVLFTHLVETGQLHSLLHDFRSYESYLRKFLETNKLYNLLWVYEAESGNFTHASDILLRGDVILKSKISEQNILFTLSKLFTLVNEKGYDNNLVKKKMKEIDSNQRIVSIQREYAKLLDSTIVIAGNEEEAIVLLLEANCVSLHEASVRYRIVSNLLTRLLLKEHSPLVETIDFFTSFSIENNYYEFRLACDLLENSSFSTHQFVFLYLLLTQRFLLQLNWDETLRALTERNMDYLCSFRTVFQKLESKDFILDKYHSIHLFPKIICLDVLKSLYSTLFESQLKSYNHELLAEHRRCQKLYEERDLSSVLAQLSLLFKEEKTTNTQKETKC
ncbi:nucleoporin Nup131 [Schizosaccharomyces octosporus yFS286]|uniref:Nucleoporin Nup131 n=1 Tax=Schizosaccharomyces octosporus (strain yFS286) TaxID=483514 RepID=S9R7W0_SCHOY|nr:nucleoporin Nup131 [Schizosaccharomyces octosporus yFS286]EPX74325.1 nucleoporin Nup131 [Schizosaccharomyces octosporus yFS286]